jgi:diguanylate cyclase (GGDEF)-like protein
MDSDGRSGSSAPSDSDLPVGVDAPATDGPGGLQRAVPALPEQRLSARARSTLIGGLIGLVGVAGSVFLASEWQSSVRDANRKSFQSTAMDLSSALESRLNTNIGLTRTMRAIATMEPAAGETRLLQWYQQLEHGAVSQPDVVATLIQVVPASGLSAFRRGAEADSAFRALLGNDLKIIPAGERPSYCLTRAMVGRAARKSIYPGLLDYCAPAVRGIARSPYATLVSTATDTASFIVTPLPATGGHSPLALGAAVYRRGAPLATVPERRAALMGFIGTTFDSAVLIRSILNGRSMTMALYHRDIGGPLELTGRAGANPRGRSSGYSTRANLGEGWTVLVSGQADHPISANGQGLFVLIFGLLATALLFTLYRVLSRSRLLAWALVGEKTDELAYRALHDPLTALPNRDLVIDRAGQIFARARRLEHPVTALFTDIDGFKQINDRFGHRAGDEVLRQVGGRLKAVLRDSDTVGRLGGDEFVMLVDAAELDASPELVAERVLDVLRQPIELPGQAQPISITASMGIATGLPASAEDLLLDAGVALHQAKAAGRDCFVLFESQMQTAARDRVHLEMDLAAALEGGQLFLAYQPMLSLETERVVGVEALLRWSHPARGVIGPDAFIPIAEENGLIVPIGRWVIEAACTQCAAWHAKGYPLDISVNVSARQLERKEFVSEVCAALGESGLDPATLTLEITETVLMREPENTARLLADLKALGIRIAVDDFGTGYSSLAYLRQFPVDSLKIDRTFITSLVLSSEAHALAHTLIQLGKALGLQTLAEGVEHRSQIRELQREGCDLAQGFLFARPLTPDALERFLRDRPGLARTFADRRPLPVAGR